MITLTGVVYHEEKPVFLCPLYHPCVDEWNEKSKNDKSGWISLLPYFPPISLSCCNTANLSLLAEESKEKKTYKETPSTSISLPPVTTSSSNSFLPQPQPQPQSSLPPSSSSCPSDSITSKQQQASSSSSSPLTIHSSPNCSGIQLRFEVDRWSLVRYNLTLYQLIYVFKEIWRSKNFRKSVVRKELIPRKCRRSIRTLLSNRANIDLVVRFKVDDCHSSTIDWYGNYLFLALVIVKLKIEETLSILSTLGGAYSSLGEHYLHFAVKAGETSIKQIGLAQLTDDPTVIARCSIYMVYSLCQRDLRKRARRLIRNFIYPYITKMITKKTCDNIVRNMYKAAKFRVEHYYNEN